MTKHYKYNAHVQDYVPPYIMMYGPTSKKAIYVPKELQKSINKIKLAFKSEGIRALDEVFITLEAIIEDIAEQEGNERMKEGGLFFLIKAVSTKRQILTSILKTYLEDEGALREVLHIITEASFESGNGSKIIEIILDFYKKFVIKEDLLAMLDKEDIITYLKKLQDSAPGKNI